MVESFEVFTAALLLFRHMALYSLVTTKGLARLTRKLIQVCAA